MPIEDRVDLAEGDEDWKEYVKKKKEGNVTKYEETVLSDDSPSTQPENSLGDTAKLKKQAAPRPRKTTGKN